MIELDCTLIAFINIIKRNGYKGLVNAIYRIDLDYELPCLITSSNLYDVGLS